jgi:hypothetical protein
MQPKMRFHHPQKILESAGEVCEAKFKLPECSHHSLEGDPSPDPAFRNVSFYKHEACPSPVQLVVRCMPVNRN